MMDPAPVSAAAVASSRPREAPEAAPPAWRAPGGSYIAGGIRDPIAPYTHTHTHTRTRTHTHARTRTHAHAHAHAHAHTHTHTLGPSHCVPVPLCARPSRGQFPTLTRCRISDEKDMPYNNASNWQHVMPCLGERLIQE